MCDAKTEVYSRVVGYYRPVQNWNPGKQAEFKDRVVYRGAGKAFTNMAQEKAKRKNHSG